MMMHDLMKVEVGPILDRWPLFIWSQNFDFIQFDPFGPSLASSLPIYHHKINNSLLTRSFLEFSFLYIIFLILVIINLNKATNN